MQQAYYGVIGIAATVAIVLIFSSVHHTQTYWEKQSEGVILFKKGKNLENKFQFIITQYRNGLISKDECKNQLELLLTNVEEYISTIENEITFLNVSHIYKSAKQLELQINSELELLSSLV